MRSTPKLDIKSLQAFGAEKLAAILLELADTDASVKRRLKLELASAAGADRVAADIRKRLVTIGKSRSFIDWRKSRAFAQDLEAQRQAIMKHVAPSEPQQAFDLLWQFLALAPGLYERCDDSNGMIVSILDQALDDLGDVANAARPDPDALADKIFAALRGNDHSQYDGLITLMAKPLGPGGLARLKSMVEALASKTPKPAAADKRKVVGWSSRGPIYQDQIEIASHARLVRSALAEIADARGDVDDYVSSHSAEEQASPAISARIARRMLEAGRAKDAMTALSRAEKAQVGRWPEWNAARIDTLDALGRHAEAQEARWAWFEATLQPEPLRAYLKRLADFDNDEAEARALAYAASFKGFHHGLWFLVNWPALEGAARMILTRQGELDGNHYEILSPAAAALEAKHPLAATLALRAMIDFSLEQARSKRYGHAARHLATCGELARRIPEFAPHIDHDSYMAGLKARHGRKSGFWSLTAED